MIIKVRMSAFMDGRIREVTIPDETVLHETFHYGQNDHQPQSLCSVSVGDVIECGDKLYMVMPSGFMKIAETEYQEFIKLPHADRVLKAYGFGEMKCGGSDG